MICGGRYLSSDDAMRVFAAGSGEMRIEVKWRSGRRSVVNGVKANWIYEVDESGADEGSSKLEVQSSKEGSSSNIQQPKTPTPTPDPRPQTADPIYEDVSGLLGHRHHEEPYDDFERQPLLANKLSQLGPGVCWYDVDGDGWEDVVIGSGRGGRMGVYRNDGKGGFVRWEGAPFEKVLTRDQAGVVGTGLGLLAGSANYEDGLTNGGCVRIYDVGRKVSGESVLGQEFSVGPLALGDVDGDGDLDLFVGGRVIGGRYPEGADSLLLRNEGGRLVTGQRFEKVGLVSGAVFSDLDGDGRPELILACEWGPIRIFRNEGGKLVAWDAPIEIGSGVLGLGSGVEHPASNIQHPETRPQTPDPRPQTPTPGGRSTLNQLSGWWRGVPTGDLDGDGRMDIVVSNWGLNSKYRASPEHPRRLYYGSLEGGGSRVDLVETYYAAELGLEVPQRDMRVVGGALPFVREKYGRFEAYGKASVQASYGERLKAMKVVEVKWLESVVLMNRGDHFELRAMPGGGAASGRGGVG